MNKYEVEFSYVNYDADDNEHDGGPVQFSIDADCKECAFEEAYGTALEMDGVDEITDMIITCTGTGEQYNLNDIEEYLEKEEDKRIKELKERIEKCYTKYKNSERAELLKKLYNDTLVSFKKDVKNEIKKLTEDGFIKHFSVYIDEEKLIRLFDKAPSDNCKLYIALMYCGSAYSLSNIESEEQNDFEMGLEMLKQYLETKLAVSDYKYLRDKVANFPMSKTFYNSMIEELEKNGKVDLDKIERVGSEIYLV